MPYTRAYRFILWMYPFFHSGKHFLTFGATFSLWRDFFISRDFFSLARLFYAGTSFVCWHDVFSLVRLFFASATFFAGTTFSRGRDFFSLAQLFGIVDRC